MIAFIGLIRFIERGPVPRRMIKALRGFKKVAWGEAGKFFHEKLRDLRFSAKHALAAKYGKRKRSYIRRKKLSPLGGGRGVANPLQYRGDVRSAARIAQIAATSTGVKIRYPGLRGLNRKHPRSRINMRDEFTRVLETEAQLIADGMEVTLDEQIRADNTVTVETVTF